MIKLSFTPRIIRAKQAPGYLGMCRDVFNKTVRPYVNEFPIGLQGIGFDRVELDQWADAYIATHAIEKRTKYTPSPNPESPPSPGHKRHSQITSSSTKTTSTHKPPTSEEFHKLVAEIMGKPAAKKGAGLTKSAKGGVRKIP